MADILSCRAVLNIMVFFGFMVNYVLRVNFNIAIVDMIYSKNSTNGTNFVNESTHSGDIIIQDGQVKFTWSEVDKNQLIGAFFWGYLCTELPGGRLAEIIGGRKVFGYSMLFASFTTLLSPLASKINFYLILALRVVLGFMLGVTWPAMHPMATKWIPPNERSKFVANMMASALGGAFAYQLCGFVIDWIGWEYVFYFTGIIGLVWSILWFALIHDTPADHPRITIEEKEYIEKSIGFTATNHEVLRVPWLQMLTTPCVWAIILTHALSVFGYFTIINQMPNYCKNVLKFDIKKNGISSSLPSLGKYFTALGSSCFADFLRSREILSITATRKVFTTFATLLPGLLMISQVFLGKDPTLSIIIFTLALTFNGAVTAGYLGNGLDIAPNFSGTIFGLANTFSSIGGYISSLVVGFLTNDNVADFRQWQYIFGMLGVTYVLAALIFLIYGSGKIQSWNSPSVLANNMELDKKESEPLKKPSS